MDGATAQGMKCQGTLDDGTPCDFVFKEKDKFCSQCGQKRIESPATVLCSCGKLLTWAEKFCSECGQKVDPALVGKQNKKCGKPQPDGSLCSNALSPGEEICGQCRTLNPTPDAANKANTSVKKEIIPLLALGADGEREIKESAAEVSKEETCADNAGTATLPARVTTSDTPGSSTVTTVCSRPSQPAIHDSQSEEKLPPANDTENSATQVQQNGTPGAKMADTPAGASPASADRESQGSRSGSATGGGSSVTPEKPCQNPPGNSSAAADKSAQPKQQATDLSGTPDANTMKESKQYVLPEKENTTEKASISRNHSSEASRDESSMEPVRTGRKDSNGKSVQEIGSSVDFDPSQDTIQNDFKGEPKEPVFGGAKKTLIDIASEKRGSTPLSGSSAQCQTNDDKKQSTGQRGLAQGTAPKGANAWGVDSESADRRHHDHDATPYLKRRDEPEDTFQGKKKKRAKQNQDHHDPIVDVVFHVLISEDFELNDRKRPCLEIGDSALGGWGKQKEMDIVRKFGSHTEVRATVSMAKSLRNKGFEYKYGLLKLKEKASENKFSYECVYTRKVPGVDIINRRFFIPDGHKRSLDIWHQYDGLAYPEPNKGIFKRVADYFFEKVTTKIRDDVLQAAECFLPPMNQLQSLTSLEDVPLKAEKILRDVDEVMTTLRYQMVDSRRERPDPELITKAIAANVLKPLMQMMIQLATGKGTEGHRAERKTSGVVLGVLYILFLDKYQIQTSRQAATIVFRALALQVHEQQTCPELQAVQKHFHGYLGNLHIILLEFVKAFMSIPTKEVDVIWLHCIPLVHFLRGDSKPHGVPDPNLNHDTKAFWGVIDLQQFVNKVKENSLYGGVWIPTVEKMLEEVKPSFQVDRLMPRTFVALLNIPQLPVVMNTSIFLPDVCAAVLTYFWRETIPRYEFQTMADCHNQLRKELTTWLSSICKDWDSSPDPATSSYLLRLARTLQDLLEEVTKQTVKSPCFVHTTFSMLIMCLDAMTKLELKLNPDKEPGATQHFNKQVSKVIAWLRRTFSVDPAIKGDFLKHIKIWNAFVKMFEWSKPLGRWENEFTSAFQHDALQMSPERCFEVLGEENISDFSDAMQAKVQHVLFAAFEKMAVNDRYYTRWNASRRTGEMMSRLLQQNWPKDQNLLQFILTWPPIKLCLEKFYGHEAAKNLTEECQCRLTEIIARIDGAVESLRTGKISLTDLELMKNKRQSLISVLLASAKSKGENPDERVKQWMRLLEAREEEVNAFIQYRDGLATLANFCCHLHKADSIALMGNLRRLQEVTDCCLDKLCTPRDEEVILTQRSEPVVNPLELPDDVLAILPALHKLQASSIFISMWRDAAVRCQDKDINTATLRVWKDVSTRWNNLCMQVQTGSISFAEMNRHLRVFQGNEQLIRKELEMMTDDRNAGWIQERITQLDRYQSIQNCVDGAEVILGFKTGLGLTDEFQPVQRILEMGSKRKVMMNQLSDAVWNLCKDLKGITADQVRCLKELENSKELMQWLKESLPGIKVLRCFAQA